MHAVAGESEILDHDAAQGLGLTDASCCVAVRNAQGQFYASELVDIVVEIDTGMIERCEFQGGQIELDLPVFHEPEMKNAIGHATLDGGFSDRSYARLDCRHDQPSDNRIVVEDQHAATDRTGVKAAPTRTKLTPEPARCGGAGAVCFAAICLARILSWACFPKTS